MGRCPAEYGYQLRQGERLRRLGNRLTKKDRVYLRYSKDPIAVRIRGLRQAIEDNGMTLVYSHLLEIALSTYILRKERP